MAFAFFIIAATSAMGGWRILPNGDAAAAPLLVLASDDSSSWREQLHSKLPNATRITLWNAKGEMVASSTSTTCVDTSPSCEDWAKSGECTANPEYMLASCAHACGQCSDDSHANSLTDALPPPPIAADDGADGGDAETLYAVLDDCPFVWPTARVGDTVAASVDSNAAGDSSSSISSVNLRLVGRSPRSFVAEAVATAEECAAIRRLGEAKVTKSVTFEGGKQIASTARTSDTGWLELPPEGAGGDEAALRRVWLRIASIVRMDLRASENMQALHYDEGAHYHYHIDTGGHPSIASRAITVLLYLNDGFGGGETNFALSGAPEDMRNVHAIRHEFDGCQTEKGLTVAPVAGSALLFYNHLPNSAQKDYRTWHCANDVRGGQKWAANLWFHHGAPELLAQRLRPKRRRG